MRNNIRNTDKQGKLHGEQIDYYSNDNISWIENYHHGLWHGYQIGFNPDNTISFKQYCNMNKWVYEEDHVWSNQIRIKI